MTRIRLPNSTLSADPDKRMKRSAIARKTKLNARNRKRQAKRKSEGLVYGPYHRWIETMPCLIAGKHVCGGRVEGHHIKTVGSGGQDYGNEVPACMIAHGFAHVLGIGSFNRKFNVNLKESAARYARLWEEREGEPR